ncbi:hypothetical protein ACR3H8_20190 [Pseudomonas aeruginosa]|nr:hypothetical protein [Pseudomonas aeruginosa]ROZ54107.1 hypothetical protein EEB15_33590 [Ramlibacter sp. WS9]EIU2716088.1 hypothetical protein [Pseudomonas aeruginosa]EIU2863621.1 hypothetical protein [Pseudomonas aeruginosa]ELD5772833.1 hypothetical protein [Pseudomonas aeruginosa]ERW61336.1 hypothetical protein Q024_06383 [Pseudomonas aeruginosa BWHPSA011]
MTLMIDATDLKEQLAASDRAHKALSQARERWLDLQVKLFAIPPAPADVTACNEQQRVVDEAKAHYEYCLGYVAASLRFAILQAENRQTA